jgi:hypothetical protein
MKCNVINKDTKKAVLEDIPTFFKAEQLLLAQENAEELEIEIQMLKSYNKLPEDSKDIYWG